MAPRAGVGVIITLLTDFGTADGYVAEMKGVILTMVPNATIVDVAHDVAPHDIDGGRLTIARYWRRFPEGTVHVAVVDPGVGSARAAIAVASDGHYLVGPDNGLLSPALLMPSVRVVELEVLSDAAPTFHGRDVFAPAAARLAAGVGFESLGTIFETPVVRRTPEAHRADDGTIVGEVISIDRFGNAITNLIARGVAVVRINGTDIALGRAYADVEAGQLVALTGSNGLLEIAMRDGSAAQRLALTRGMRVELRAAR